jgi:hypothetical protein
MLAYGQGYTGESTADVDLAVEVSRTAAGAGCCAGVAGTAVIAAQCNCSNVLGVITGQR